MMLEEISKTILIRRRKFRHTPADAFIYRRPLRQTGYFAATRADMIVDYRRPGTRARALIIILAFITFCLELAFTGDGY